MKHLILLFFIAILSVNALASDETSPKPRITDLAVEIIDIQPVPGSTLKINDPITVKFKYKYTSPNHDLPVWAKVLDETYDSTYEGSMTHMKPGEGTLSRFIYLTEPGSVKTITIVAKDQKLREIFKKDISVNYTYIRNDVIEQSNNDGMGSKILSAALAPGSPGILRAGSKINVQIRYDINATEGLDIWAMPLTTCNMTYEGTTGRQAGKGTILKMFSIGEKCEIKKIKLLMKNSSHQTVFEKIVDVDLNIID